MPPRDPFPHPAMTSRREGGEGGGNRRIFRSRPEPPSRSAHAAHPRPLSEHTHRDEPGCSRPATAPPPGPAPPRLAPLGAEAGPGPARRGAGGRCLLPSSSCAPWPAACSGAGVVERRPAVRPQWLTWGRGGSCLDPSKRCLRGKAGERKTRKSLTV